MRRQPHVNQFVVQWQCEIAYRVTCCVCGDVGEIAQSAPEGGYLLIPDLPEGFQLVFDCIPVCGKHKIGGTVTIDGQPGNFDYTSKWVPDDSTKSEQTGS